MYHTTQGPNVLRREFLPQNYFRRCSSVHCCHCKAAFEGETQGRFIQRFNFLGLNLNLTPKNSDGGKDVLILVFNSTSLDFLEIQVRSTEGP